MMSGKDLVTALSEDPEPFPDWLQEDEPPFDRKNFFGHRTVYYPGSGNDDDPVRVCAQSHAAHTFIYVDYGVSMSDIRDRVHGIGDHSFRGYGVVREDELDVYPKRLLVGSADVVGNCYKPWYGYTDTRTMPDPQGAVGNPRKLYRLNRDCLDRARGRVKRLLLLEIHAVLKDHRDDWMKMRDIADQVNERDRYGIRDRSPVTADQVHEMCRKHRNLLERDGSLLRWKG